MADQTWQQVEGYGIHQAIGARWQKRDTGILDFQDGSINKTLFIKEGVVTFATSNSSEDKLPEVLMNLDHFTRAQFDSVTPNFKEGLSMGRNLVEVGLITQQQMVEGAKHQVYQIFQALLQAKVGQFQFKPGDLPSGIINLPLNFPNDVFKAFNELDDKEGIAAVLGSDLHFICTRNKARPLDFKPETIAPYASTVLDLIDGERDFNQIAFETEVDEFTLIKFLYAMGVLGYIDISADDGNDASVTDLEEDEPDIRQELTGAIERSEVIEQLSAANIDETIEIGSMQNLPSIDETIETSRLGIVGETIEQPSGFAMEDEDPEMDRPLEGMGGEEDLTEERELHELSKEMDQSILGLTDEADGAGEKKPRFQFKLPEISERDRRALMIGGVLLTLGIAFFLFKPMILDYIYSESEPMVDPPIEKLVDEFEDVKPDTEPDSTPPETQTTQEDTQLQPEENDGDGDQASEETEDTQTETQQSEPESAPPEEESKPPNTPVQKPSNEPPASNESPTNSPTGETNPAAVAFSPLVDNWGQLDPGNQQQDNTSTTQPESEEKPAEKTSPPKEKAIEPQTTPPPKQPVVTAPPPSVVSNQEGAGSNDSPDDLLGAENYAEAAKIWESENRSRDQEYTIALELVCQKTSIRDARRYLGDDPNFFLLPRKLNDRDCYWLCWKHFNDQAEAREAIASLPDHFRKNANPTARKINTLLQ